MPDLSRNANHSPAGKTLLLGGALGNLYDRIVHGHVVDFISL
ncbi:signal peptidase II, partial [Marinobacterium ramblicola]